MNRRVSTSSLISTRPSQGNSLRELVLADADSISGGHERLTGLRKPIEGLGNKSPSGRFNREGHGLVWIVLFEDLAVSLQSSNLQSNIYVNFDAVLIEQRPRAIRKIYLSYDSERTINCAMHSPNSLRRLFERLDEGQCDFVRALTKACPHPELVQLPNAESPFLLCALPGIQLLPFMRKLRISIGTDPNTPSTQGRCGPAKCRKPVRRVSSGAEPSNSPSSGDRSRAKEKRTGSPYLDSRDLMRPEAQLSHPFPFGVLVNAGILA